MRRIIIIFGVLINLLSISNPGFTQEAIRIGAIFAKSGEASSGNMTHLKGVRFAVAEINKSGGVLGRPIELVEYDNQSKTLNTKIEAQKAVKSGIVAVIGASWSSHSIAMAPVFQEAKIPMITPVSTNPTITLFGDYIFRACFTDSFQGAVLANFAVRDLKLKNAVVLINSNHQYSIGLADNFIKRFKELGGNILWEADYLEEDSDYMPILDKVRKYNPDMIFLPGYFRDSGLIIKQARIMGLSAVFLGGDAWNEEMYRYGGKSIEGSYFTNCWHPKVPSEKSRRFVTEFEKVYGKIDNFGTALAYDSAFLLAAAITLAGSDRPAAIRDALAAIRDFEGVTGKITFDENGDPRKPVVILKFDNGNSIFVKNFEP